MIFVRCWVQYLLGRARSAAQDVFRRIRKNPEKFQQISAGLQNLAVVISLLMGSIWAILTFLSLNQVAKSRKELNVLEVQAFRQTVVEIDLEVEQIAIPEKNRYVVSVVASIANKGNQNSAVEVKRPPLSISLMEIVSGELVATGWKQDISPTTKFDGLVLRVGSTTRLPFMIEVPGPGLYLVVFQIDADKSGTKGAGVETDDAVIWQGSKLFWVTPSAQV